MSKRTFTIDLDGEPHSMRPFTLDQLERIAELFDELPPAKRSFAILRMALKENTTPAIENPGALELTQTEVLAAVSALMRGAGLDKEPAQGEAAPPAEQRH